MSLHWQTFENQQCPANVTRGKFSKQGLEFKTNKYCEFLVYDAKMLDKCVKSQKCFVHCPFLQGQAKENGIYLNKQNKKQTANF